MNREMLDVVPHDPSWGEHYEAVKRELATALSQWPHQIEHIGGTAVPGLSAQAVIDVLVGLPMDRIDDPRLEDAISSVGFRRMRAESAFERRVFIRRGNHRDADVHVVSLQGELWYRLLVFRDFLRANPPVATQFSELKGRYAAPQGKDFRKYQAAKSHFILSQERVAIQSLFARDPQAPLLALNGELSQASGHQANGNGGGGMFGPSGCLRGGGQGERGDVENPFIGEGVDVQYGYDNSWIATPSDPGNNVIEAFDPSGGGTWKLMAVPIKKD